MAIEIEIETPHSAARAHVQAVDGARGTLVLGHGAGGGVGARDLVAAAEAARAAGFSTVLVEQPYRVAGRRWPAPAHHLDAAWTAVIEHLRAADLAPGTLVVGGRSSGARVACRTAAAVRADGVLCLAFPLQPPARAGKQPAASRLSELQTVGIPVLIVQGETDRFGIPPEDPSRTVVLVRGDHALRSDLGAVSDAVRAWLSHLGDPA